MLNYDLMQEFRCSASLLPKGYFITLLLHSANIGERSRYSNPSGWQHPKACAQNFNYKQNKLHGLNCTIVSWAIDMLENDGGSSFGAWSVKHTASGLANRQKIVFQDILTPLFRRESLPSTLR